MIKLKRQNNKYSVITTERLVLREWTLNDVDDLIAGLNNYGVAKNLTIPFPYTEAHARYFIRERIACPNDAKVLFFAAELKNSGKIIGGTSISVNANNVAEGGVWVNADYHGKGYGTEIFRVREVCFNSVYLGNMI